MSATTKRRLEMELFPVVILLGVIMTSCHKDAVRYYQREGRTITFLESEFRLQHELLNRGFKARDSSSSVKVIFLDTIQTVHDTVTIKYDYMAVLPDGDEIPLTAPEEGIFSYIGKQLPNFALPNIDGKMVDFKKFYGKPLVLNFWFRACTPCKKEMPRLNHIRETFHEQVNFVAICLDDIDELKGFFKYHDFDYEHLINGREVANELGIMVYPKNIVLNRKGEVSQILDALLDTMDEDENVFPGEGAELIREIEKVL